MRVMIRRLSAIILLSAANQISLPERLHAQALSLDARLDSQRARADAAANTGRGSLVSRYSFGDSLLSRYPYGDQGGPQEDPSFTFNFLFPVFYNSNAEALTTGGTQTLETTPEVRLAWSKQLDQAPIKLSMLGDLNSDRYARSNGADADTAYAKFRVQYNSNQDDQEFQPFIQYTPTGIFAPTFGTNVGANHDLAVGFDKVFNFDYLFRRIGGPESHIPFLPDTSRATVWSFGFTGTVTRRLTDLGPDSYGVTAAPSISYNLSNYPNASGADAQWSISFEVDVTRRWYDTVAGFARRDWLINPIFTVEFVPPLSWFRGATQSEQEKNSKALGRPKVDFQLSFSQLDSNNSAASYRQWQVGPILKTGWSF